MDLGQILSWVVGAVGLIGFYFAGQKKWWCWWINVACQVLWATYALVTGQPAFLVTAAVYSVIFVRNAIKWTKEHRLASKWFEPGEQEHAAAEYAENESNLVKHARFELERIGEEPEVIDWYLRVIREYTSFGHSGGSHMAIMPSLTRLLNFQPLGPLTNSPAEWFHHGSEILGDENGLWQNKRDGRAFSEDGGETFYYVDESPSERSLHISECNICWERRYNDGPFTCPGCGKRHNAYLSAN